MFPAQKNTGISISFNALLKTYLVEKWYTIFVQNVKYVEMTASHYQNMFCFLETSEAIFANFWNSSWVEQAGILRHIQWKSLKIEKETMKSISAVLINLNKLTL